MIILLTNDDGINAPGFAALCEIAKKLTNEENIFEFAPATNQSCTSHSLSYRVPFTMERLSPNRYVVDGTPADCVLASLEELPPKRPDLILSGVNSGNNAGQAVLYSGTVGAAIEGALQGIRSIALSQYLGPLTRDLASPFESAQRFAPKLIQNLLARAWDSEGYMHFYNINFPPCPADLVKGTRVVAQSFRNGSFESQAQVAPNRMRYHYITGPNQHENPKDQGDVDVNLSNYIALTPMSADLTRHEALKSLESLNSEGDG